MYRIAKLNKIANIVNDYFPEEQFAFAEENPHGVLVRSADMHEYDQGANLLAVARAGAGTNNIPCDEYARQGIVVFNTPGANANAVKELVLTAILLSSRKILDGIEWAKTLKGQGDAVGPMVEKGKSKFAGQEIKGKRLGVIGLGAIGVMVANDALKLGMQVTGYDPFINVEHAWQLSQGIKRETSLEKLVAQSDYITIHVPLMPATKGMLDKQLLHKAKRGAVLINFARGGLVDDEAVLSALALGRVGCYITDFPDDRLLGEPGVIAIPHLGASTAESEDNCAHMAAAQLAEYLLNGNIKNSVNFPEAMLPRTTAHRITLAHKNVTNMVGQITAVLASSGHNIADMINKSRGELAYTIIDTDHDVTDEEIKKIMAIDGMIRVRSLGRVE